MKKINRFVYTISFLLLVILKGYGQNSVKDSTGIMSYKVNNDITLNYERPKPFEFIKVFPRDYKDFFKRTFRKDQIKYISAIAASTAILLAYDEEILMAVQKSGQNIHLPGTSNETPILNYQMNVAHKDIKLQFNIPTDLNSTFYYLGDGWTHTTIALAFWAAGLINKDNRELRTSSEIAECIITTGIATQFLKHITGRQSPFTTTVNGGAWHFFPNQSDYADHVPNYDAFPSGHLATAMATVTVIAQNYPEKKFIRPVGYTLMGLLGYSMLNNGVHWASDYPLGIALGYAFAKIAVSHGRTIQKNSESSSIRWKFSPSFSLISSEGLPSVSVRWHLVRKL